MSELIEAIAHWLMTFEERRPKLYNWIYVLASFAICGLLAWLLLAG